MRLPPCESFSPSTHAVLSSPHTQEMSYAGITREMHENKGSKKQRTIGPAISMKTNHLKSFMGMYMILHELVKIPALSSSANTPIAGECRDSFQAMEKRRSRDGALQLYPVSIPEVRQTKLNQGRVPRQRRNVGQNISSHFGLRKSKNRVAELWRSPQDGA
jgi:hypothetical protein